MTSSDGGDQKLLDETKDTHRILLTRDGLLFERANKEKLQAYAVRAIHPESQFREVLEAFGAVNVAASGAGFLTRCLDCNSPVIRIPKEHAQGRVPQEIWECQSEFFSCRRCERLYWKGSHYARMREWLEKVTAPSWVASGSEE